MTVLIITTIIEALIINGANIPPISRPTHPSIVKTGQNLILFLRYGHIIYCIFILANIASRHNFFRSCETGHTIFIISFKVSSFPEKR